MFFFLLRSCVLFCSGPYNGDCQMVYFSICQIALNSLKAALSHLDVCVRAILCGEKLTFRGEFCVSLSFANADHEAVDRRKYDVNEMK